uniref:Uncharacterized protein n=1 Tax=Acrobeloides nanus TaxID=290746 RepID=A0A914CKY5_9BILA
MTQSRGKILFSQKDFTGALNAYSMAIVYSYDEQFLARILSNRALVHLKLNNYHFCYIDASEAIKLDRANSKAYYRQGKALIHLGFFSRARDAYKRCLDLAINDQVAKELAAIENKVNDPQLPIIELDHYIPMEPDPELFNRTLFTRDLNLFFFNNEQLVEGDAELVKLLQYGKFDVKKWKSAAKLEEILFTRVREEIQKKNYEKASIYLWLIESLECDVFEGQMKGPHPGFAQLNAVCCYLSGKYVIYNDL